MATLTARPDRLFRNILIGVGLGASTGLVFGELVAPLRFASDGFLRLLQVNVLPFVVGSLIVGFGSCPAATVRTIAGYAGRLLFPIWMAGLLLVMCVPLALPPWEGAPVFAAHQTVAPVKWIEVYVPANVFSALAGNMIPAVVVFSILAGLALGQVTGPHKHTLLQAIGAFNDAMARVSRLVIQLTPFGLFAVAAVTAGETHPEAFLRLQVWVVVYAGLTLVLVFWLLPGLVTVMTPLRYREVVGTFRSALITAFAAGDAFVVLPLIAENVKTLVRENENETATGGSDTMVDLVAPMLFNFPHVGKVVTLGFLPFGAWFIGQSLSPGQFGALAGAGFLSLFGNINAAVPFLLDILRLPADLFSLFAASAVVNSRIGALSSTMHNACLALLIAMAVAGKVQWRVRRILGLAGAGGALILVFLLGTRTLFAAVLPSGAGMEVTAVTLRPPLVTVRPSSWSLDEAGPAAGTRLDVITNRGTLRAGYFTDAMPWSYLDGQGQPIGHDIEAAHALAFELGVQLELHPIARGTEAQALALGRIDILMGGFGISVSRARVLEFSHPYAEEALGLLVRDFDRSRFSTLTGHGDGRGLLVAVRTVDSAFELRRAWPEAVFLDYESTVEVLDRPDVRVIEMPLDRAFYWSRTRVEFSAVAPPELRGSVMLGYGLPAGEPHWRNLVNAWVDARRARGLLADAYDYWVLGSALQHRRARWSVVRDVFGWAP